MDSSSFAAPEMRAHFQDMTPIITYRHLHAYNLSNDPLRVVALVDSDAFYAQAERNRLELGDDVPLVVQQWDSLIAVSYPARKFGISRFDKVGDAKRKCPDVVAVHVATYQEGATEPGYWEDRDSRTHKVSLDYYRRESAKVYAKFKEGVGSGEVEKASIDEVFLDLSTPIREMIFERWPSLRDIPPTGPNTPLPEPPQIEWSEEHGHILSVSGLEEDSGIGKGWDSPATWHDVALSIGGEIVNRIRLSILKDVRYTTSGGIARNKALAKLVASYRKPNSQTILRNGAIPGYLCPLSFQKIRFLGGKLGEKVAEHYKVTTVGELLSTSLDDLKRNLGEDSVWLYELIRGIDRSEVKEKSTLVKSMLASKNLKAPVTKVEDGPRWIRVLAAELHLRIQEARKETAGLWPKTLVLHIRHGYSNTKSKQTAFPFVRDLKIDHIVNAGNQLWNSLAGSSSTQLNVTNLQLSFTGLEFEHGQSKLEGFFSSDTPAGPANSDEIELQTGLGKRKRESDNSDTARDMSPSNPVVEDEDSSISFLCEKCGQNIRSSKVDSMGHDAALDRLRLEHDDFHMATELARSNVKKITFAPKSSARSATPRSSKGGSSDNKSGAGIAGYFRRKGS